jgi:glycine oxidase
LLNRILNDGPRYLVPRDDGRILVGSTEEDAGFDRSNTAAALAALLTFAQSWSPALAGAPFERAWSGFRPATLDGKPYLGKLPNTANGFVAAGHFRNGLQLSTGTAVVMRQLLQGERPQIDLTTLAVERATARL